MKTLLITIIFFSANYLFSQNDGKAVKQSISNSISSNSFISIDISELVTGTYFISFELNGIEFKSDKFIVVK